MERSIAQTIAAKTRMVSKQDSIVSRGFITRWCASIRLTRTVSLQLRQSLSTSVDGGKTFLFNHKP